MAQTKCDHLGHEWQVTSAPGWFRCGRVVAYNVRKNKLVYCNAIAVCPGCLGYRLSLVPAVLCVLHQHLDLDQFAVAAVALDEIYSAEELDEMYRQETLW